MRIVNLEDGDDSSDGSDFRSSLFSCSNPSSVVCSSDGDEVSDQSEVGFQ